MNGAEPTIYIRKEGRGGGTKKPAVAIAASDIQYFPPFPPLPHFLFPIFRSLSFSRKKKKPFSTFPFLSIFFSVLFLTLVGRLSRAVVSPFPSTAVVASRAQHNMKMHLGTNAPLFPFSPYSVRFARAKLTAFSRNGGWKNKEFALTDFPGKEATPFDSFQSPFLSLFSAIYWTCKHSSAGQTHVPVL